MSSTQHPNLDQRSREEKDREDSMGEVSAVLLNLEHAIRKAERAQKAIKKTGADPHAERALKDAIAEMRATRKTLMQRVYYRKGEDQLF